MKGKKCCRIYVFGASGLLTLFGVAVVLGTVASRDTRAGIFGCQPHHAPGCAGPTYGFVYAPCEIDFPATNPEVERRTMSGLFNRLCIRCHGVDGKGLWDIPNVPNFTNSVWQGMHSDQQLAFIILEGRGAIMPSFRGRLTLDQAFAMARYLRKFLPSPKTRQPNANPPVEVNPVPMPEPPKQ